MAIPKGDVLHQFREDVRANAAGGFVAGRAGELLRSSGRAVVRAPGICPR